MWHENISILVAIICTCHYYAISTWLYENSLVNLEKGLGYGWHANMDSLALVISINAY